MNKTTTALACAALLVGTSAMAQNVGEGLGPEPDQSTTRVGTRGASFLEIPVGARQQALAGAGVALIDGVESLATNVGSMANIRQFSVGWSYSELFGEADITHQFFGAVLPIGSSSSVGAGIIALNSGDITRTSERFPEGGDPQFGSTFEYNAFAASLGWGQLITDRLGAGAAVKFIQEGVDNSKAEWVGLDLGVVFRTGLLASTLGASIQNIGGESSFKGSAVERRIGQLQDVFPVEDNVSVEFDTDELTLPTLFRFSLLVDVAGTPEAWLTNVPTDHNLRFLADVFDAIDTSLETSLAVEYDYREIFYLRGGKRFFNEQRADFRDFSDGLSFGAGVRIPDILDRRLGVEYAYTDMGLLERIQTFSIQLGDI